MTLALPLPPVTNDTDLLIFLTKTLHMETARELRIGKAVEAGLPLARGDDAWLNRRLVTELENIREAETQVGPLPNLIAQTHTACAYLQSRRKTP